MTMFDDQPDARIVLRQRQAHAAEDTQHAASPALSKPFLHHASTTRCSPGTPEQSIGDMHELGFSADRTPGSRGGLSSERYAPISSWHRYPRERERMLGKETCIPCGQ